ncbi:hypothetical protein [Sharpea azabuensis]|uniref:hypothetical protein n=1 Tax=Sharpea azabuensis TaxID=322505 RepID=UPI00051ACC07|nr:hypothetical protein [Sharpea azabuensis]
MDEIAKKLKKLKFKRNIIGGVNERDVWKKLDELQIDYRHAFEMQENKYQAIIDAKDEMIEELLKKLG